MTSEAPKYTKEQVTQYYDRIGLQDALRIYEVADVSPKAALSYLRELQKHHLVSIPFENLVSKCIESISRANSDR
jgi:arylamine N-acetyltransferase